MSGSSFALVTPKQAKLFSEYRENINLDRLDLEDINSQSSSPSQFHQSPNESPRFRPLVLQPPSPVPGKLSSIPTSATSTQSEPETLSNLDRKPAKMVHKIRVFRGLRNNCEDPAKFLKALEWAYRLDYKQEEPGEDGARKEFREETMKILFSSHLSGKAEDWYNNLEVEEKSSWPTLVKHFQTYYQLVPRDTRTKLFNLKMKLADFKAADGGEHRRTTLRELQTWSPSFRRKSSILAWRLYEE